jgi:hypothetical protein
MTVNFMSKFTNNSLRIYKIHILYKSRLFSLSVQQYKVGIASTTLKLEK